MPLSQIEQAFREITIITARLAPPTDETRSRAASLETVYEYLRERIPTGEAAWNALDDKEKLRLETELMDLLESYRRLAKLDGPSEKGHLMSSEYASNKQILSLAGIALGFLVIVLTIILWNWNAATTGGKMDSETLKAAAEASKKAAEAVALRSQETIAARKSRDEAKDQLDKATASLQQVATADDAVKEKLQAAVAAAESEVKQKEENLNAARTAEDDADKAADEAQAKILKGVDLVTATCDGAPTESMVISIVLLFGVAGGCLRMLASLVKYVGNRELYQSWLLYYYVMPFQGAILAPIVYMLLRVGVLAPSVNGQSGTAQVNLLSMYVFAALTGLFAKNATDKLSEVFNTIFRVQGQTANPLSADATHRPN